MILIFSILVIAYYYFAKDSQKDNQKLTPSDSKKRKLTTASLIVSLFILVSGLIFLEITIEDDDIDIEISFN